MGSSWRSETGSFKVRWFTSEKNGQTTTGWFPIAHIHHQNWFPKSVRMVLNILGGFQKWGYLQGYLQLSYVIIHFRLGLTPETAIWCTVMSLHQRRRLQDRWLALGREALSLDEASAQRPRWECWELGARLGFHKYGDPLVIQHSYWKLPFLDIYSWFTHQKWWFTHRSTVWKFDIAIINDNYYISRCSCRESSN